MATQSLPVMARQAPPSVRGKVSGGEEDRVGEGMADLC